jgi:pre-mRNA-splicing factor CWC26
MSSLADYLAKNYLTADPPPEGSRPKKKRKKKHADPETETGGLIIADDDPPSLRASNALDAGNDGDESSPYILNNARATAEFRRTKKSSWKTVGGGDGTEQAEADAILASAAAESEARADANEDGPTVEEGIIDDGHDDGGDALRLESGMRAGLQTAAQTAAMVAAQERRKKTEAALYKPATKAEQETIYRDASGRIINVAMKRAEARRAAEEAKEKEERAKEALMGDVQRQQKETRRQELREARAMPLARTIEDETMNEELKAQERWNDPAAQFLTTKREKGVSKTGRPLYMGGFAPNRYGIRPGHRWDGIDRSTGFEKEWFQARARKERVGALEYAWQMDE